MKIFISLPLLGIFGTGVDSFSVTLTSCSLPKAKTAYNSIPLYVTPTAQTVHDVATTFWGQPRNEQEIIDFVSDEVFNNKYEASINMLYARPKPETQDQWVEVISAEPPLLVVHGFLEHEYCDQIIDATLGPSSSDSSTTAAKHQLKRSTMGAEQEETDHRTSSTAWLQEERCSLPLRTFATRTAALSGLPPTNMENLQVVRYQPGEEFQEHTDHLDSFNEFDCGGRLCTCLVYLNDSEASKPPPATTTTYLDSLGRNNNMNGDYEATKTTFTGGETNFPGIDAAITPKKGSALFFWNTLERPGSENYSEDMFLNVDLNLRHAGLPVLSGEKWVANRWIHPRKFGKGVRGLA